MKVMTGMIIKFPEDDESQDKLNSFIERLDEVTDQYSCGQDDGKVFFATEHFEVIRLLREEFPNVPLQKLNMNDYPWDQCHV